MNSTDEHLKALLKSGWTKAEIAEATKIDRSVVSRWANHGVPEQVSKAAELHKLKPRKPAATKGAA
jgi:transcriptional regulator with XRE-family HTH domain